MLIGKEALRDNEAFFGKFQELFLLLLPSFGFRIAGMAGQICMPGAFQLIE
ncbi:MAG: hypothetical protein KIC63_08705 [Clostridium sp.]|nr:hypothetical protein [Clostridium sp.]